MKIKPCDKERFLRDTGKHEMKIIQDDEVFRHIRYENPESSCYSFQITTFPGHLVFSGDMGCFVFARVYDMFKFFRHDDINDRYWHEKLIADNVSGGSEEYCPELFESRVKEWFRDWLQGFDADIDVKKCREVWQEIKEQVLSCNDCEYEAMKAAYDFRCNGFEFTDFFEVNLKEYTFHFIWCLYAIVWAIQQYDKAKSSTPAQQ